MFIGIELVKDRETKEPAKEEAYRLNYLQVFCILLSSSLLMYFVLSILIVNWYVENNTKCNPSLVIFSEKQAIA